MLYIDGLSVSLIKDELKEELLGRKLSKIYQYDKYNVSLMFGKKNLKLSINPSFPIIYLAEKKDDAPDIPLGFSLTLRKYLLNSTLRSIEQIGMDRILSFNFDRLNELGEVNSFSLIFELMGKHSNVFLCDSNNNIIDLLKKFSLDENKLRVLLPGNKYIQPVLGQKENPMKITKDYFDENIHSKKDLFFKLEGFGKITAEQFDLNYDSYKSFIDNFSKTPTIYYDHNKKIAIASLFSLKASEEYIAETYESINEMINIYIQKTISSRQHYNLKGQLDRVLSENLKKTVKIIKLIKNDLKKNSDYEKYKKTADILAANIFSIKHRPSSVELFDFYENENTIIQLDPNLSPNENLDKYYKKYNKLKRAEDFNYKRLEELEQEKEYLESVAIFVGEAQNINTLKNIEEELIENKYIKRTIANKKQKKKSPKTNLNLTRYKIDDDFELVVGTNNKENDYITFKLANKTDIWLHAKNIPGSHVLIRSDKNKQVPEELIEKAAGLAAFHSKGKLDQKVTVDYTFIKHVKKPKGAKPGFVIYTDETSIEAKPRALTK